jgi:hypothetical protein
MHKFASNAVEKCYERGNDEEKKLILYELFVEPAKNYPPLSSHDFITLNENQTGSSKMSDGKKYLSYLSESPVFHLFSFIFF